MKSTTIEAILKLDKERGRKGGRGSEGGLLWLGNRSRKGHGMGTGNDRRRIGVTSDLTEGCG